MCMCMCVCMCVCVYVYCMYDIQNLHSLVLARNIVKVLLPLYIGIEKECRVIRDFYWEPPIEQLFESRVLRSSTQSDKPFLTALSLANFHINEYVMISELYKCTASLIQLAKFEEKSNTEKKRV